MDGTLRIHNVDDGKQIRAMSGTDDVLYAVAVGASDHISAGGQSGRVWTWKLDDGKLIGTSEP